MDITSYLLGKNAGGTAPTGEIEITQNGITNVSSYATANVNVPQPSGKITITENGTNIDVSSYATADVSVGGSITDLNELYAAEANSQQALMDYLNNTPSTRQALIDENITLYTPDANFPYYAIFLWYNNNNEPQFRVCWFKKDRIVFFDERSSNKCLYSNTNFGQINYSGFSKQNGVFTVNSTEKFCFNYSINSDYVYYNQTPFTTLQDAINALKTNQNIYDQSTSGGLNIGGVLNCLVSNTMIGVGNTDTHETKPFADIENIISHNETIQVIGA